MTELRIALWNCSGLLSGSSANEKVSFLQVCLSFDILILIETHHQDINDIAALLHTFSTSFTRYHTEASSDDPYAGIVILVSNRLSFMSASELLPGRLLNLRVCDGNDEFNLSAVYGYTGVSATIETIELITSLLSDTHDPKDNNIILGDFNFVDNALDRTNKNGRGLNHRDTLFAKKWVEFLDGLDLSDPFRLRNPRKIMYSYIHTQHGAKSRIDRVYTNDENCSDIFHYAHTPTRWQHRVVSFSVRGKTERGPGYWKMNTSILSDRAYSLLVESIIDDINALIISDPIERWLIFVETVRIDTQAYCSKKRFFEKQVKKWCEREIEMLERNPRFEKNTQLQIHHEYFTNKLHDWTRKQIEGHQIRIKTQPKFEHCEPDIDFYANMEKKSSKKKIITHLKNTDGEIKYASSDLKLVATDYYKDLFGVKPSDSKIAKKLLQNVEREICQGDKTSMDRLISKEELRVVVMKLKRNKSPGPDGIPAEFYQRFWHRIEDFYFDFILQVERTSMPPEKNSSVTSLIFKNKGDISLLAYYRPIALMNVDIKILTKLLSMRLVKVLPSIIHKSQTAVYGRNIGDNIHLVRDIIDLVNRDDEEAALLFIDQEKAFDRVNHSFLYKVLKKFGIGGRFIHWVQLIYSNASTRVNINGFLTDRIPLKCGVRQGCPLSALLYVMIIEILALQLRKNPNIVGFVVEGERIVSSHYADDTVIKITQNRCFKEVYKELKDYERATGAKVNYDKTQGLWLGKWRNRQDDPFEGLYDDDSQKIRWTSGNVKHLGIYVGNDDPVRATFREIVPKMTRRLNFWKPLKLPTLAKSRVIEIFHASKLFYAASFYTIPPEMEKEISLAFMDYIIFPRKKRMVSRMEMEKLRSAGGLKLINIGLKAETPKIQWLMKLITHDDLGVQRNLFERLIGSQTGWLTACDAIFAEASFISRCNIDSSFYREALLGISKLHSFKHYEDINNEHFFYNRIFTTTVGEEVHDRTLTPFRGNRTLSGVRTYGDLLNADASITQPRLLAALRRKLESIEHIRDNVESHRIIGLSDGKEYEFESVSQKQIYSELVFHQSRDHPYVGKWHSDSNLGLIDWDAIWDSVHSQFYTEKTKSSIWEQLHLNFYTTHNFNTWYNQLQPCFLCRKIPEDVFHIIFDCKFTKVMWRRLEKVLLKIMPTPLTLHEMAFGLQQKTKEDRYPVVLRNWVTFTLRHFILLEEYKMYKIDLTSDMQMTPSYEKFFANFNYKATQELKLKKMQYDFQGMEEKFKVIVTCGNAVAHLAGGEFVWHDLL